MIVRFVIDSDRKHFHAIKTINDLPTDGSMEVVIQKHVKKRTSGQNRYQWKAILGDISRQVRIDGKGYTPKIWHEHLKGLFLPDVPSEELTLPDYVKWEEMPDGTLKMVGSTTKLTTKGMSIYFERLFAYAVTELDVRFTSNL
jgi:hypothetical protein